MNEIEHYGVKGMKWGVRRTPEQLGHYREKALKKSNKRYDREIERARKQANRGFTEKSKNKK